MSKGNVWEQFIKLRNEMLAFSMDVKKTDFVDFLCDQQKMCLLAYVTDIFGKLNKLNTSMREKIDRIDGFRGKLAYWRESLSKANFTPFPQISQFLKDNSNDQLPTKDMCSHPVTPRRALCLLFPSRGYFKV